MTLNVWWVAAVGRALRKSSTSSRLACRTTHSTTSASTAALCPLVAARYTAGTLVAGFAFGLAPSPASRSIAAASPTLVAALDLDGGDARMEEPLLDPITDLKVFVQFALHIALIEPP